MSEPVATEEVVDEPVVDPAPLTVVEPNLALRETPPPCSTCG